MRTSGAAGQPVDCNLNSSGNRAVAVVGAWPKDWYTWVDRTTATPDTVNLASANPTTTGDAGTLLITADGTNAGANVSVLVVLWDDRGKPIGLSPGTIAFSSTYVNAAGTYPAVVGSSPNLIPAHLTADVTNAAGYSVFVTQISAGTVNLHVRLF